MKLPLLAGLLLPALGFLRHDCYPPLHVGITAQALSHHCGCRLARSPDVGARRLSGNKEWRKPATLIPDVDYEPELFSVKHKRVRKVKNFHRASVLHARAELLLLRVTLDRERDQAIDQPRVG